jgi:hypothetical protein
MGFKRPLVAKAGRRIMHATAEQVRPEFSGTSEQQELVERVYNITIGTAQFFSATAPITVSLQGLAEFVAQQDGGNAGELASSIDSALSENEHVFRREEREDGVFFVTTRSGLVPAGEQAEDRSHSFAQRFSDPPPTPENAPPRRRSQFEQMVEETAEPTAETVHDVPAADDDVAPEIVEEPSSATPTEVEEITNLDEATDEELAQALREQLAYDYSVANFGDEWMAEDKVPRLSRGDLRRIKDYIGEQGGPVSDHQIVQDLLGIRQSAQEYPLHLFSVNFRLSRETRDFEFVGIAGAHFWTTSDISTPTVANRKASEVGQDYRVLLGLDDELTLVDEGVVEHVLTFYEYRHGVLPYDANFQSIISGAVLQGQRSAIVHFESPLTSESFPVEVRFPTGNRGGFLAGFAEFFKEHLVPGAFVTIEAGEKPGTYTIEFLTVSGQDRKLLTLDEKKNQYKFDSTTFYCAPNEDMLVAENRFPKLAGTEPLDDRTRRQPEKVLTHAFNYVGERVDSEGEQLMAVMDELVAAANIERPMPAALIRALASSDTHPEFILDPEADDVVYYRPGTSDESAS